LASVDTLHVAVWTAKNLPELLTLTRFMIPVSAHDLLVQWYREKAGRTNDVPTYMAVAGLSEVLSLFVPETAYMVHDREPGETGQKRQCLYFLGDLLRDGDLRTRLRNGILMWLGILYPDKDADMRISVGEAVFDDRNWRARQISTRLKTHNGVCALPEEGALFDALTVHVVAQLAGKMLQFQSGKSRILVPRTPQTQPFGGVELVAFPPKKERDGQGLYTEVVTISAANFPEQRGQGIQILAQPSIRNWGPVQSYDLENGPSRSLDVFMPPREGADGYVGYRHTSFPFKVIVENWKAVHGLNAAKRFVVRWESQKEHRIFDLVGRLAGSSTVAQADHTRPVLGDEGLWVLPRLAPGNGDRYLAGASGVGWHDRNDITESLDAPMRDAGFERSAPMKRIDRRMPISGPFKWSRTDAEEKAPLRRASLLKTLGAIGNPDGELDLLVLHKHEASPERIQQEIKTYFGVPEIEDGDLLAWDDGLKIRLIPAPSGPLAEALPYYELPDDERTDLTKAQQDALARARQDEEIQRIAVDMARHIEGARRGRKIIGCAILEMAASLKDKGRRDPFVMARRLLAEHRVLPQVVLVDEEAPEEKYRAAVRDLIRMLGVLPAFEEKLPIAPAALTVIQRNDEKVGGGNIVTQAFPLAVRIREGIVECAIPEESGEPEWMPYAHAALRIYSGDYGRFARNRTEQNQRKFDLFFSTALDQIDRQGPSLVLADMDTVAARLTALRNGNLLFDVLSVGNRTFSPENLPNTRIVRTCSDTAKLPCYFQTEALWPGGLFGWGDATRTAYGVKKKSVAAKSVGYLSLISRHLPAADNRSRDDKPRRIAALDEICAVFKQPNDEAVDLVMMTHRLRSVHAQYDDDTSLPFPLHELRLLGGAVTS
jgi:hypothetical protein